VIQQLRQQPPWNVCSNLELSATMTCLTYNMLTTAVGFHAHDVAIVHWWFVPKFIFSAIKHSIRENVTFACDVFFLGTNDISCNVLGVSVFFHERN
jgi:hypothetical protein